mmetsp:Transcript_17525/g.44678  ORF Transcript_17525/g.44678 Transcript_17525/m.44678 type:complete len:271 (-) Transcript_17525:159-971(-)
MHRKTFSPAQATQGNSSAPSPRCAKPCTIAPRLALLVSLHDEASRSTSPPPRLLVDLVPVMEMAIEAPHPIKTPLLLFVEEAGLADVTFSMTHGSDGGDNPVFQGNVSMTSRYQLRHQSRPAPRSPRLRASICCISDGTGCVSVKSLPTLHHFRGIFSVCGGRAVNIILFIRLGTRVHHLCVKIKVERASALSRIKSGCGSSSRCPRIAPLVRTIEELKKRILVLNLAMLCFRRSRCRATDTGNHHLLLARLQCSRSSKSHVPLGCRRCK